MRWYLLVILSLTIMQCLLGLGGCRSAVETARRDYPEGTAVYSKRTQSFAGKILRYEPNHSFPGGAVEAGVLIAGSDGQTGWYPVRTLNNSFIVKR